MANPVNGNRSLADGRTGDGPDRDKVAKLAYEYWEQREHPGQTAEQEDWSRAVEEIKHQNGVGKSEPFAKALEKDQPAERPPVKEDKDASAEKPPVKEDKDAPAEKTPVKEAKHDPPKAAKGKDDESKKPPAKSPQDKTRYLKYALIVLVLANLAIGGYFLWDRFRTKPLGPGFASGNGRVEAVDVDISAKSQGKLAEMFVDEGDNVTAGQIVAKMDTDVLEAQLKEERAEEAQDRNALTTALANVNQRESQYEASLASITQREAERVVAGQTVERSKVLSDGHAVSVQDFDNDVAKQKGADAALRSSQAQAAASNAMISAARSQGMEAKSKIASAIATENRIRVQISDGILRAPRAGRIQYRVAQPGEVIAEGGKVLNMIDLSDVKMTFFLSETVAGRVALGSEVHIVLDSSPQNVIPATVSFVASINEFTPKTVMTDVEREKLVFRIKAKIAPALLLSNAAQVKSGEPGMAYVRLDASVPWPEKLRTRTKQ